MATAEVPHQSAANSATPAAAQSEQPEPIAQPEPTEAGGEKSDHTPGDRFRTLTAVLIASIAILGAVTSWQAEVAATRAAEFTQRGIVIAINLAAERTQDRGTAMGEAADVMRVQQLLDERDLFKKQLALTPPGPSKDQLKTESGIAFWVAEWESWNDWPERNYLYKSNIGIAPNYNIGRRTSDLVSASRVPANSGSLFTQANRQEQKRRNLLWLDLGLVIGLACATVAHQLARRGRLQTSCTVAGSAIFALGIIALLTLEV